ncbi:PQQ-binding-like beta-propeller repeat protein [Haloprofundus halophilus]|uniref:PQQ-binding-like beta-propeller repeat protein n=1 Tax=Haloprofundus halophilus TaxID=2283527 RepID=UPI000E43A31D|nr:PQQ-binding-like beta-propeller repeat protein [Haloprofundus halophilus]
MVSDSPSRRGYLSALGVAGIGAIGVRNTGSADDAAAATGSGSLTDWPMPRYDAAGTGYVPDARGPGETVDSVWSHDPEDLSSTFSPPILADDRLYLVSNSVAVLDAFDGEALFTYDGSSQSNPAIVPVDAYTSDTLALAGVEGLVGLNADGGYTILGRQFGVRRWRQDGESPSSSIFGPPTMPPPIAVGSTLYWANSGTDHLYAVDASSGRMLWERELGREGALGEPGRPAYLGGTVYASYWPYAVGAFDAQTGEMLWETEVTDQFVLPVTATSEAILVPGREGVTALDPANGDELWRFDHGGNQTEGAVAVADVSADDDSSGKMVYVVGEVFDQQADNRLYAVDLETGEQRWSASGRWRETTPVVGDDTVYISEFDTIAAFDASTGDLHWRFEIDSPLSTPIVSGEMLFCTSFKTVHALGPGEAR